MEPSKTTADTQLPHTPEYQSMQVEQNDGTSEKGQLTSTNNTSNDLIEIYPTVSEHRRASIAQISESQSERNSYKIMIDSGCTTHAFSTRLFFTSNLAHTRDDNHVEIADN